MVIDGQPRADIAGRLLMLKDRLEKAGYKYHWNERPVFKRSKNGYEVFIGWDCWVDGHETGKVFENKEKHDERIKREWAGGYEERKKFYRELRRDEQVDTGGVRYVQVDKKKEWWDD